MINYNWIIFVPLIEDAEALGITELAPYLDEYWGARVLNGTWIVFNSDRQEALFRLKYSQYILRDTPNWAEIIQSEDSSSNP